MRVLTVRQPWAWAIIHGGKDVENRTRNIAGGYRGPVAIHAGIARFEDDGNMWEVRRAITSLDNGYPASDSQMWAADLVDSDDQRFIYGSIIGVVNLVDVHMATPDDIGGIRCRSNSDAEWQKACSLWVDQVDHHLVFANPRALPEPIPLNGGLGLRRLDEWVEAEIQRQLVGA